MTQLEQFWAGAEPAAPAGTSKAARIIRTLPDFGDIRGEWDTLAMAADWGSPIQHYLWARSYVETFGSGRGFYVVATGSGRSAAIAPLFRPRRFGGPLEMLGVKQLFEVMDFVYTDASDVHALANALSSSGLPIVLGRIRANSPALAALRTACSRNSVTFCRPARGCPFIVLDASWLEPERHINTGRRSDLRRSRQSGKRWER